MTAITDLPPDVLPRICLCLDLHDILSVRSSSRKLSAACSDDLRLWAVLCAKHYGSKTNVESWRAQSSTPGQASYWATYKALHTHAPLVGLWTGTAPSPTGSLFAFRWSLDSVACHEVKGHHQEPDFVLAPLLSLGPLHPTAAPSVHPLPKRTPPSRHLTVTVTPPPSPPPPDETAAHVAGASMAGSFPHHLLHPCASPPDSPASFPFHYLSFTQSLLAPRARRRRQAGPPPGPTQHHFTSLPPPHPSRRHPLAGFWKGVYGPHGLEMLSVKYNTDGPSARIEATKVLGDRNVPAGEVSWWAEAAPLPHPLDRWEEQEVPHMVAPPVEGAGHLRSPGRLVAVHRGQGQVAGYGFQDPMWVEGRLWVFDSGDLEFVWLVPFMFVVRLTRVDLGDCCCVE